MPIAEGLGTAKTVFDVAKDLGLLASMKDRLLGSPRVAQVKLAETLSQIQSFHSAVNAELVNYLSLDLGDMKEEDVRKTLLHMTSGEIEARLEMARYHCSKIEPIYHKHLSPLFEGPEAAALREVFLYKVVDADGWLVKAIKEIAAWLAGHAAITLKLFNAGNLPQAQAALRAAADEIQPVQAGMRDAMRVMIQMQIELLDRHGD